MSTGNFLSLGNYLAPLNGQIEAAVRELTLLASKYPNKALFATRFTPEDQILTHLIFQNQINIRVYASGKDADYEILVKSVDFFKTGIEVLYQQSRKALTRQPKSEHTFAADEANHRLPLTFVLDKPHLSISSLRQHQLEENAYELEWDEALQRTIYYPLLHWNDDQINAYLHHFQVPYLPQSLTIEQAFTYFIPSTWGKPLERT